MIDDGCTNYEIDNKVDNKVYSMMKIYSNELMRRPRVGPGNSSRGGSRGVYHCALDRYIYEVDGIKNNLVLQRKFI